MKKFILLVILSFPLFSYSQQKIVGFGKLKLGMDLSEISELNPKEDTIEKVYDRSEELSLVFRNKTRLTPIELISDTNLAFEYSYIGSLDKRVRHFHFGKLKINDEIFLTDINLLFFNNKLYTIYTADEKLDEMMGDKYGKVLPSLTEKEVYFTNGFGNTITKIEKHYKKKYITNVPNYSCSWSMDIQYLNNGDSYILTNTWLTDSKIENIVTKTERAMQLRSQKRELEKKKNKLNKF
jgi:hypothetical protein